MASPTISAAKLCSITGMSDRHHRRLASQGYFPHPIESQYQAGETFVGIIRYLTEQNKKKTDTLRKEQEALTKAKRESAQIDVLVKKGKLLDAAEYTACARNLFLNLRAVLKRKFEQELAMNLMGLTDMERRERIKAAIDEYLAILYEGVKQWVDKPPPKE